MIIGAKNDRDVWCGVFSEISFCNRYLIQWKVDTRFARRASRESEGLNGFTTRGSPLGIGQPRADFLDTFGVVSMPRCA